MGLIFCLLFLTMLQLYDLLLLAFIFLFFIFTFEFLFTSYVPFSSHSLVFAVFIYQASISIEFFSTSRFIQVSDGLMDHEVEVQACLQE